MNPIESIHHIPVLLASIGSFRFAYNDIAANGDEGPTLSSKRYSCLVPLVSVLLSAFRKKNFLADVVPKRTLSLSLSLSPF
jgi:hypothetical protein